MFDFQGLFAFFKHRGRVRVLVCKTVTSFVAIVVQAAQLLDNFIITFVCGFAFSSSYCVHMLKVSSSKVTLMASLTIIAVLCMREWKFDTYLYQQTATFESTPFVEMSAPQLINGGDSLPAASNSRLVVTKQHGTGPRFRSSGAYLAPLSVMATRLVESTRSKGLVSKRRKEMTVKLALAAILDEVEGDFVETGVYNGGIWLSLVQFSLKTDFSPHCLSLSNSNRNKS